MQHQKKTKILQGTKTKTSNKYTSLSDRNHCALRIMESNSKNKTSQSTGIVQL